MFKLSSVIASSSDLVAPKAMGGPPIAPSVWEAAVGTRIALKAEPTRLDKKVLYVRVVNAAWANELALLTTDILTQLAERGIDASALRFSVGPLTQPQRPRDKPKLAPPTDARLPAALEPCVNRLPEGELRSAIVAAATKSLAMPR